MFSIIKKNARNFLIILCATIIAVSGIVAFDVNDKNESNAAEVKETVADKIIEEGKKGDWNYRKWESGVAECWGTVSIVLIKDAYEWIPNISCASGYGPVPEGVFTTFDCVSIDPIKWYQIGASGRVTAGGNIEGHVFGTGADMSSLKKGDSIKVNCIVKGKWK